jgi:phenylacetate-CoA ligase
MTGGDPHPAEARPRSGRPGLAWPLVLTGQAAMMEVLRAQFGESERAEPAEIRALQRAQIGLLAAHAHAHSAFWRARLDTAGFDTENPNGGWFEALPILTRSEAKAAGETLFANPAPPSHGKIDRMKTSGSTGTPLEIAKTDLAQVFWYAITLRDSLWHRRNLQGKLAAIRVGTARATHAGWSPAYAGYANGPCVTFDAREDIDAQLDWLLAEQPDVLLTHASNLHALACRSIERGCRLHRLNEARSFSERLAPDLRERVREAWNVPLTDMYSANEVGYIALQCPDSGLYHVQSEDVMVEIVDAEGQPCAPGETGRVVATSLHNFAMPLIRYDLGDHAIAGGPCTCGRTLPTLERILGRTRNMLKLPGGGTAWPGFPMNTLMRLDAIRELRMIQHTLEEIEVELVLARPLSHADEAALADAVRVRLGHPFRIRLTPVARIARGRGGKMEDFECRVI